MVNVRFLLTFVVITLLVSAFLPASAQGKGPDPVGLRPDAPDYAKHGPYWVGIKDSLITFTYKDGTKRESKVTVWYPALNPDNKLKPFIYPAEKRITDYAGPLFFPRTGAAFLDAIPDPAKAPYPLIVYSHGGWGYRWFNSEYCEHLASFGFVVLSTDHEDAPPIGAVPVHAEISRQWDISGLIDYAVQITAPNGTLAGLIDTGRIGVTGYSAGGFTTMMAGGARRSSTEIRAWCATKETQTSWIGPLLCPNLDGRDQVWAKLLGVTVPTNGLWPDIGDKRVNVIVSLDGGAHDFGTTGLSTLRVPALLIFARGAPAAIPYKHDTLLSSMEGSKEAIAIFESADHALFMSQCLENMLSAQTVGVCAEPVWDKARAHDLIHHLSTAFLLDVLKGDKDAHKALLPDAVKFPGITYKTTMK